MARQTLLVGQHQLAVPLIFGACTLSLACGQIAGLNDFEYQSGGADETSSGGGNLGGDSGLGSGGMLGSGGGRPGTGSAPASGGGLGTGGAAPGTGGAAPGTGGDGSGGDGSGGGSNAMFYNGWGTGVVSGWSGGTYTYGDGVGSIYSPDSFEMAGENLCVSGTLAADLSGFFGVSWHINQEMGGIEQPILVMGEGLELATRINTESLIRVNLYSGGDLFCVTLADPVGGKIPWNGFQMNCWEAGGAPFDPTVNPVTSIGVYAASTIDSATELADFCVDSIDQY